MTTEMQIRWFYSVAPDDQKGRPIERTAVITEGVGDITTLVGPVGNRDSPRLRVGVSILDILRDLAALEPPERDLSLVPEHSNDPTAGRVEGFASTPFKIVDRTAGVVSARALALETKGVSEVSLWLRAVLVLIPGGNVRVQLAFSAGASVQRVLIDCCRVHILDDINLMKWFRCGSARQFIRVPRNPLTSPLFGHCGLQGRLFGSAYASKTRVEVRTQQLRKENNQH